MSSSSSKWQITFFSALIFVIVVHPFTYGITQSLFGGLLGRISEGGCPTNTGLLLHTLVYILLVRGSMEFSLFR